MAEPVSIEKEFEFDDFELSKSALHQNKSICDESLAKEELESARDEWQQIESVVPSGMTIFKQSSPITYEQMLEYFRKTDMSEYSKNIKPEKKRKAIYSICPWFLGPPKIRQELLPDRNLVFSIAQFPFDNSKSLHVQLIQTLYKSLTGIVLDCPQYGTHWEEIGFQGSNPSTDLRGVGFLGLLHLLYLIFDTKTKLLAREIYKLSHSEEQHFPFCVLSINITRITLEALREGVLNRNMNKENAVFPVVNEFYAGTFYYLYSIWKQQKKTIMDSGYVIQDVSKFSKKNVKLILESLNNLKMNNSIQSDIIQFSDIGDITVAMCSS